MTLYTSDTNGSSLHELPKYHQNAEKTGFIYLLISILCALFGAVYEVFSHEVYSFYMIYAFAFPLVGGALPFYLFSRLKLKTPGRLVLHLYHSGIATLTVGSILKGVLIIYGTTNTLLRYYWFFGFLFAGLGILLYLYERIIKK